MHLNTPASIHYTAGQTLSLTALRQRKSRVECVVLPESMSAWRQAFQRYIKEENYGSYAADVEDERMGNGVVLPPLVPQRSGPLRRRARDTVSARDAFFCGPACTASAPQTVDGASAPDGNDASPSVSSSASAAAAALPPAPPSTNGITIVSHHKVAGRQQFVYPDHDGVLSAGVVPQIVVTEEEKADEEASKVYYIAALEMTEAELAALEELQALWRSQARSHSYHGAQHRNAAKGVTDPSASPSEEEGMTGGGGRGGGNYGSDERPLKTQRVEDSFAEAETAVDDASTLDKELAEALRLADELLRFA